MIIPEILTLVFTILLGLAVGSFLNVCIYRIPNHSFFSSQRSYCPKCNHELAAKDNVPLFSYIFLGGKCRYCHEKISPIYPFVELLNLALWLGVFFTYKVSVITFFYYVVISTLIVMSFIDLKTKEIPNGVHVIILLFALISFGPIDSVSWQSQLIGSVVISVPLFLIALITGGIGGGDIKLFFVLGMLLGWKNIVVTFFIACILAGIVGIGVLIVKKKNGRKIEMPFGPFIAIGTYVAMLCGELIVDSYLALFTF